MEKEYIDVEINPEKFLKLPGLTFKFPEPEAEETQSSEEIISFEKFVFSL